MSVRWKNWYEMPRANRDRAGTVVSDKMSGWAKADNRWVSCTRCGKARLLAEGEIFTNHCASFESKEEAEHYAPKLYSFAKYLGPFPEGKTP